MVCLNGHVCCEGTPQHVSTAPNTAPCSAPGPRARWRCTSTATTTTTT
ncbi:hypothetical protein FLP41_07280 [Paracoccus marcusii]|nr:hypothetical protein FLP41_07280 [Paracoccus marcusii]